MGEEKLKLLKLNQSRHSNLNKFSLSKANSKEPQSVQEDTEIEKKVLKEFKPTPSMEYKVGDDHVFRKDISDRLYMNPVVLQDYKNYSTKKSSHGDLQIGYIHRGEI